MLIKYARKFKEPVYLQKMFELRRAGFTLKQLALIFDCDFSTIYHHCNAYQVYPTVHIQVTPNILGIVKNAEIVYLIPKDIKEEKWYILDGEKINKGKSYQDYLTEQKTYANSRLSNN